MRAMRWWDRRTRNVTRKLTFDNPITSMELSSQTQRLVVTSGNMVAFIPAQPAEIGTPTHSLNLPYAPSSASVHPIWQDRFVTGSTSDEWVRVHKINGEESELFKGHHGPVHCVEYSPDGEVYASGSGECKHVYLVVPFWLRHSVVFLFLRICLPEDGESLVINLISCAHPVPTQAPSDCGRPRQGRRTAFGKEPPMEARRSTNYRGRLISIATHHFYLCSVM
jgi:WD40 repeat protein